MRNKLMTLAALLIIASMVLAACQTQPVVQTVVVTEVVEKEGTPQVIEHVVTATPVPPTEVPPTPEPKPADTVVIVLQQEPDTLHPLVGSMSARTIAIAPYLVGCMAQDEEANWTALGCEEIPTLENGGAVFVGEGADKHLEVTYKIREGWRWTDGTPVTSKDAIFFHRLIMDPTMEVAARNASEKIYDMVALDDYSWKAVFMSEAQAHAAAEGTLTGNYDFAAFKDDYVSAGYGTLVGPVVDPVYWFNGAQGFLPEHVLGSIAAVDQPTVDFTQVPGDGPFYVKEWKQGQELVLAKSDQPFPLGDAKLNTVIFRFYGESASVIAALQNGEVDVVTDVGGLTVANAPDLDKIEAAGTYSVMYRPGYQWEHIDLNVTKFPLDDLKVRQALYHATDKQALVQSLYFGRQSTTDLPIPPGLSWAYTDSYTKYPFDPEKAKALLAEAGWDCSGFPCTKDGKNLELVLMTTDRSDRQALAQVLQQQWKKIGFGVNLQFLYGRSLFSPCSAGGPLYCRTFDAAIYTWSTGDDPSHIGTYDCASIPSEANNWSGQNNPGFCNKEADEALFKNELDPEVSLSRELRKPWLEKFYKIWTDNVPVIPLFSNTRVYVYRPGLQNFRPGPTQYGPTTWNIWEWELYK